MRNPIAVTKSLFLGACVAGLSLAACGTSADVNVGANDQTKDEVVYGTDNRVDVYASTDTTLVNRAKQSTVALMEPASINTSNPNNVTFNGDNLQTAFSLCSTERFLSDPTAAFCSGTLIDNDLVLTAGHCVTSATSCSNTRFVFNYYRTSATAMQPVTTADIFSCSSIVARQQATINGKNLDFAILRLDRAATPRFTPAPVRTAQTALSSGAGVAVIGCGSGIPYKIDNGGKVRDPRATTMDYFMASTDTFGGNSGSGVYEMGTYNLVGILVRGDTDYVQSGSCYKVNVCAETACRGEDSTYVMPAIAILCQTPSNSARLCGSTPPPPPPPANSFTFSATNTNSAQQNTTNKTITLADGDTLNIGTCGVTGATATGDTYIRLYKSGTSVASNDDACGGRSSNISYKVPAGGAGSYEVRAGCYSSGSCSGTVAWTITSGGVQPPPTNGSFQFSATNTNNANQNTVNQNVTLQAGQTVKLGTTNVTGATGTGDTYLRLYLGTSQAAYNDDYSGSRLSFISYTVPSGGGGTYQIRAGCYSSGTCSGTVAYTVQ